MFIGLIAQGNASREYYGYVDKVGTPNLNSSYITACSVKKYLIVFLGI